jgi:hypothetical protein
MVSKSIVDFGQAFGSYPFFNFMQSSHKSPTNLFGSVGLRLKWLKISFAQSTANGCDMLAESLFAIAILQRFSRSGQGLFFTHV